MRPMIALFIVAHALCSPALAVECPWENANIEAYATWRKVVINDVTYKLSGAANRGRFQSLVAACDAPNATDSFREWRDYHSTDAKYRFLTALVRPADGDGSCPWAKDDAIVYAKMTRVHIDDQVYKVRGPRKRGRFLSTLLACDEAEAARHFNGWRASRQSANVSAATIIGLVYTPISCVGAGYFKNTLVRDLVEEDTSRANGITGSSE